jgi:hypothetical protein
MRPFYGELRLPVDQQHSIIQLYAGTRPDGEPVFEKLAVRSIATNHYLMLHSPGFVRGVARGDTVELLSERAGTFQVVQRGGNLAVRVYCRNAAAVLDAALTPQVTQLEGRRDVKATHLLVYSIPVEAGFESVESVFDQAIGGSADASWAYGNVYDEHGGEPLNWWLSAPAAK